MAFHLNDFRILYKNYFIMLARSSQVRADPSVFQSEELRLKIMELLFLEMDKKRIVWFNYENSMYYLI